MKFVALCLALAFLSCGKGHRVDHRTRAKAKTSAPAAASTTAATPAVAGSADAPPSPSAAVDDDGDDTSGVLLPDSEPAGAPFASSVAAAVAEVTQGEPAMTSRIYRAAYEQARRTINQDNAYDRLRQLERQIDTERQSLP
jgi:hypothetical protein